MHTVKWLAVGTLCCGCAAGTMMLKAPVEQQCAGHGLKGCPELVDGVLLYIDGKKPDAMLKLKQGAAQNSPEQIRPFAAAIKEVIPDPEGTEIADLLSGHVAEIEVAASAAKTPSRMAVASAEAAQGVPAPVASAAPEEAVGVRGDPIALALAAPLDPSRLMTESVAPLRAADRAACDVAGKAGVCSTRLAGPLLLTDASTPAGCPTEMYLGAVDSIVGFAWLVQANGSGTHGARLFVRADQQLTIAARGVGMNVEGDPRCIVTWAGFRPRIVPRMGSGTSG